MPSLLGALWALRVGGSVGGLGGESYVLDGQELTAMLGGEPEELMTILLIILCLILTKDFVKHISRIYLKAMMLIKLLTVRTTPGQGW